LVPDNHKHNDNQRALKKKINKIKLTIIIIEEAVG